MCVLCVLKLNISFGMYIKNFLLFVAIRIQAEHRDVDEQEPGHLDSYKRAPNVHPPQRYSIVLLRSIC